jgi:hypothetical protein
MKDWESHAHVAIVDLAAAHLAKSDQEILEHLRAAADSIYKAIDAVENAKPGAAGR